MTTVPDPEYIHTCCVCKLTGKDSGKTPEPLAPQLSPFHRITIPHYTDVGEPTSTVDSPKVVAPKIKKAAVRTGPANDRAAPARRGRRPKNVGKTQKTSAETTIVPPGKPKIDNKADADGKMSNGTGKLSSGCDETPVGKSELLTVDGKVVANSGSSEGMVGTEAEKAVSATTHDDDTASDGEQAPPAHEPVKGHRSTSLPVRNTRYALGMLNNYRILNY